LPAPPAPQQGQRTYQHATNALLEPFLLMDLQFASTAVWGGFLVLDRPPAWYALQGRSSLPQEHQRAPHVKLELGRQLELQYVRHVLPGQPAPHLRRLTHQHVLSALLEHMLVLDLPFVQPVLLARPVMQSVR